MELKIPEPFLQKHLEVFQVALQKEKNPEDTLVVSVYRGMILRAAIKAGWLDDCDISELEAQEVVRLSSQVQEKVAEATTVSKN